MKHLRQLPFAASVGALAIFAVVSPSAGVSPSAAAADLGELLFLANQYVVAYQQQVSGLLIEEHYVQRIERPDGEIKRERTLVSDYLIVSVGDDGSWRGFRDVYQVDGESVRDRAERLSRLFVSPTDEASSQTERIVRESARYNIGAIGRNFNLPTMALAFLDPLNQHRFAFGDAGTELLAGTSTRVLSYTEQLRPTFIRVPGHVAGRPLDVYARGRFWLAASDGRVIRTELEVGDAKAGVKARIVVDYGHDQALNLWLPVLMEERYEDPRYDGADVITGVARYSNYRRTFASTNFTIK